VINRIDAIVSIVSTVFFNGFNLRPSNKVQIKMPPKKKDSALLAIKTLRLRAMIKFITISALCLVTKGSKKKKDIPEIDNKGLLIWSA
jgi:hypothetical protein